MMTNHRPELRGQNWQRVDGIDLLRGLSIVLVLMNHVNMRLLFAHVPYTRGLPSQLVDSLVWSGQYGVQIFFAVSGYLITSTSLRRWGSPAELSVREFYELRFARIAPLMMLLLAVLCGLHLAGVAGYVVGAKTGGLGRALLAALTFRVNWLEAARGYLPGNWDILWSLSVEEMFYLFFPLVARVLRKRWLLVALLKLFVIAGPFARAKAFNHNPVWREYSYLGGMDAIAMGCLTAMLMAWRTLSRRSAWLCGMIGCGVLVYSLGCSDTARRWGLGRDGLDMTVLAIGACLVIVASVASSWQAPRWLTPLIGLGRKSYEIYLTHMFAVLALFAFFVRMGKPQQEVPALFVAAIVIAGGLGWLVAICYAEPMNRLVRRAAGVDRQRFGVALPEAD